MATKRARKRHVQLDLLNKAGTGRGDMRIGKHRGGRPVKGARRAAGHRKRIQFAANQPVHVVMRVLPELGNLRARLMYLAIRSASIVAARETGARIVHISIQRTHLHLIVEAQDARVLARLMQRFQISAAKHMNGAYSTARGMERRRRGRVFADRYHASVITSPRQMRHTLAYVLNNWRRHREDREQLAHDWQIDAFSSASQFAGWTAGPSAFPDTYRPLHVKPPTTWLLRVGWKRHGLVDWGEVPAGS